MEERVGKGALILVISGFICKIFGALFRLPLTNIVGIKGIGVFQMVMSLYSLTLVFVSGGVTTAVAKLVASSRAEGNEKRISSLRKLSFRFSVGLGILVGLVFAVLCKQISLLQGAIEGKTSYLLFVLLLPIGGAIGTFRGIIQGFENMTPTAISQIIEQSIKFSLGLLFAFVCSKGNSINGIFGAFLGITFSEIVAFIYLAVVVKKRYRLPFSDENVKRKYFSSVLPLSFASAINPLTNAVESLSIIFLLGLGGIASEKAKLLYGLQTGVVGALMHFPLIISLAIAMAMLPKISFLSKKQDIENQKIIIKKSFKYMWFFLIPLTFGIISLSKVAYPLIYSSYIVDYISVAYNLTIISGFSIILSAIMQFLLSILQANGHFTQTLIFGIIAGVFKIVSLFILARIPSINIFAISISNIIFNGIICICCLISLGEIVKIDVFDLLLPLFSSFAMFMAIKIMLTFVNGFWGVIISALVGGLIYFILAMPLTVEIFKMFLAKFKLKRRNVC